VTSLQAIGEELPQALALWLVEDFGAALLFDQALVQEQHLARDLAGEAHFVGDHEHGTSFLGQRLYHLEHFADQLGSSAEVGSSNRMISGSIAKARAMATRCCWPPDRNAGY
jgi:hypothetical protein